MITGTTPDLAALRRDVRRFLDEQLPIGQRSGLGMLGGRSPEFSRALAARGWVGMAIPVEFGGHGRRAVERFVVVEELLTAGAPVQAHWVADRQIGPSIVAWGNDEQRRRFLPAITRAEISFSLGMSEPDSGSDLASVRTSATRTDGGWSVNGVKIWTSGAAVNDYVLVLCRTDPHAERRHDGLSQLIVRLDAAGVSVRPVPTLDGYARFNEVVFDEVFVPDDDVLGTVGNGWTQVTSELGHERAGPDRVLSSFQVLARYLCEIATDADAFDRHEAGVLLARLWAVRRMSFSVALAMDDGRPIGAIAAMVKDLGTELEQTTVEVVARLMSARGSSALRDLLATAVLNAPSYTMRGGTTEVLRTVVARSLQGTSS